MRAWSHGRLTCRSGDLRSLKEGHPAPDLGPTVADFTAPWPLGAARHSVAQRELLSRFVWYLHSLQVHRRAPSLGLSFVRGTGALRCPPLQMTAIYTGKWDHNSRANGCTSLAMQAGSGAGAKSIGGRRRDIWRRRRLVTRDGAPRRNAIAAASRECLLTARLGRCPVISEKRL